MSQGIKANLEAFIKRKNALDALAETGPFGYMEDFAALRMRTLQYREEKIYVMAEGEKPHNYRKNRYKDILPYDYTRVVLSRINDIPGTDFINANYIKGVQDREQYIAAQGPLPNTVKDFWRMLWEQKTQVVLMSCSEYEGDPPKHRCERYWPESMDEKMKFDKITVTLEKEIHSSFNEAYKIRYLRVECDKKVHQLHQLHYIGWPDHGTPNSVIPIIDMIAQGRTLQSEDSPPLVVHCSAGCGRTGTIIAIDYAWSALKIGRIGPDFDVLTMVSEMRKQRPSLVQSLEQYKFVYEAVAELFERHLDMMKKHAYENVELLRRPSTGTSDDCGNEICYSNSSVDSVFEEDVQTPALNPVSKNTDRQIRQTINRLNRIAVGNGFNSPAWPTKSPGKPEKPPKPAKPVEKISTSHSPKTVPENITPPAKTLPMRKKLSSQLSNDSRKSCIPSQSTKDLVNAFERKKSSDGETSPQKTSSESLSEAPIVHENKKPETFDTYSLVTAVDESSESQFIVSKRPPSVQQCYSEVGENSRTDSTEDLITFPVDDVCEDETNEELYPGTEKNKDNTDTDEYAYADPFKPDKWSLQHYALQPASNSESEYSEVTPSVPERDQSLGRASVKKSALRVQHQYEQVDELMNHRPMMPPPKGLEKRPAAPVPKNPVIGTGFDNKQSLIGTGFDNKQSQSYQYDEVLITSGGVQLEEHSDREISDDDDAPAIPERNIPLEDDSRSEDSISGGTIGRKGGGFLQKLRGLQDNIPFRPGKSKNTSRPYDGTVHIVTFKDKNMNYPNRHSKPKGPRPEKKRPK